MPENSAYNATGNPIEVTSGPAELIEQGRALQRVQARYAGAIVVQKPRDIRTVEESVKREAALIGEDGFYAWGAGKNRIEGASIELSMTLARCWGNCVVEQLTPEETRDAWIFSQVFVDLETGFSYARAFRQAKRWKIHGNFDEDRADDMRFQIGQSKAARNVILRSLPSWLVNRALDVCKGGVREKIEKRIESRGLADVQSSAVAHLEKLGVPRDRVLASFGRKAIAALTVEDLVTIAGSVRALETGSDTADSLFPVDYEAPAENPADVAERRNEELRREADNLFGGGGAGDKGAETKPAASEPSRGGTSTRSGPFAGEPHPEDHPAAAERGKSKGNPKDADEFGEKR